MPNKFARSNGDFNNAAIWSLSATGLSATTVPTIGDTAIANSFVVNITGSIICDNITSGGFFYGGTNGGTFNLGNDSLVTANVLGGGGNVAAATLSSSGQATIIGNVIAGTASTSQWGVLNSGTGTLEIIGNVSANTGSINSGARNTSTGTIIVRGNVSAATGAGNQNPGINNISTGSIIVYGNIISAESAGINNSSTGPVTVVGNVIGDSRGGAGIASTNAAANVRISGNLIGAPNGVPAVYAAAYTVNPVPSQAYIRQANNGTGVGSNAYLYYYTTDSLSAFSVPPVSAVRAGVQYANNTLTGTCQIPAASAVTFGVPFDTTTGTATLTTNNLFDVSVASLTASNSLGARLRNSATVESVGRIVASF